VRVDKCPYSVSRNCLRLPSCCMVLRRLVGVLYETQQGNASNTFLTGCLCASALMHGWTLFHFTHFNLTGGMHAATHS
jgi:hypothetical protein